MIFSYFEGYYQYLSFLRLILTLFIGAFVFFQSCTSTVDQDIESDSTEEISERRVLLDSAYKLITSNNSNLFLKVNNEGLRAAVIVKDTFDIADAYWNFGYYYMEKEILDSSFHCYN